MDGSYAYYGCRKRFALRSLTRPRGAAPHPGIRMKIFTTGIPHGVGFGVKVPSPLLGFRLCAFGTGLFCLSGSSRLRPGAGLSFRHDRFTFPPISMRRMLIRPSLYHPTLFRDAPSARKSYNRSTFLPWYHYTIQSMIGARKDTSTMRTPSIPSCL